MAQFDVYPNPNPDSRRFVPYVVDVQSALISPLNTRLVMPLSRVGVHQSQLPVNLCPVLQVAGEPLVLMPHLAAPVVLQRFKHPVESLAHCATEIVAAMDAVLSGF